MMLTNLFKNLFANQNKIARFRVKILSNSMKEHCLCPSVD